jgi:formylglycine-generating enzyme required for sulfatase activity
MGTVYRARQVHLQRVVAIKVMKPALAADEDFCERFMREARAGAAITHPNVVVIHDADHREGLLFQVFEFVPGGDLAQLVKARGPLPSVEALRLIAECADGLQAIHQAGMLHRDIKPQNIFLDAKGQAKLGDLGMARHADGEDQLTGSGAVMGTPAYMAPEQARGAAIDIRADIYALGATLYTLLTARKPFPGANALEVIAKVIADPTPDPRAVVPSVPTQVAGLVRKAMAKRPEDRFATSTELRQEVLRVIPTLNSGPRSVQSELKSGPSPDPHPVARRATQPRGEPVARPRWTWNPGTVMGLLIVLVGVVALIAFAVGAHPVHPAHATVVAAPAPWASAQGQDDAGCWADLTVAGVTQRFRWIPSGNFTMGSPADEPGRNWDETVHRVTITQPYWLADTDCTQELWKAVMGTNPAKYNDDPQKPVEQVSWEDCQLMIATLNQRDARLTARLPTEAEWEYACRAGSGGAFPGSDLDALAWYNANAKDSTHAVKGKASNPWGLYDMNGNVWQWCSDWHGDYATGPVSDPVGPATGTDRVRRGGAFNGLPAICRSAARSWAAPDLHFGDLGFRLCISAKVGSSVADDLHATPSPSLSEAGTPPSLSAVGAMSPEAATARDAVPPSTSWAIASGKDNWGTYADLTIATGVTQRFRLIHPGTFVMGSPPDEAGRNDDEVQHTVTLTTPYWLADTDCTQEVWHAVMGTNPSNHQGDPQLPVEKVSWDDCQAFLGTLNHLFPMAHARLPTEAEWEYACRAGSVGPINLASLDVAGWYNGNAGGISHPVKLKTQNTWGLYDMHGNIEQWCSDWYGPYPSSGVTDPSGPATGTARVLRGSAWFYGADGCRSALRGSSRPESQFVMAGLRLCLSVVH